MGDYSEAFVGIDTSKSSNAVAVAESGRDGEVRYLGTFPATAQAVRKLIAKLADKYDKVTFAYEAGPTGYGLYRLITSLDHDCIVVAPSETPKKPGDRVKTDRRDAEALARLLRAGELTAVWVPDARHEAMRDLSRARETAMEDLKRKRQHISSLLLRLGVHYTSGTTKWGPKHRNWLARVKIEHREQRIVFEELLRAESQAQDRVRHFEQAIRDHVDAWALGYLVTALMAMRGIDFISAVTLAAEIGDLSRFATARELMGYLGLVPSEDSSGERSRRGPITKAGNRRARRILSEAAWSYRYPPRVTSTMRARVEAAPAVARDIAWKAQIRLTGRYRRLSGRSKRSTIVATAIAREMAGFIWAIGRRVEPRGRA